MFRPRFQTDPPSPRGARLRRACCLATTFLALGPFLEAATAPHPVPGTIEGEDFDGGGDGQGFHVIGGGCANIYRPSEPVCLETVPGGWALSLKPGEWAAYTVRVERSGDYDFELWCVAALPSPVIVPQHLELTDANQASRQQPRKSALSARRRWPP